MYFAKPCATSLPREPTWDSSYPAPTTNVVLRKRSLIIACEVLWAECERGGRGRPGREPVETFY